MNADTYAPVHHQAGPAQTDIARVIEDIKRYTSAHSTGSFRLDIEEARLLIDRVETLEACLRCDNESVRSAWAREAEWKARVAEIEAALTPSTATKAAYMGEFSFPVVARLGRDEVTRQVAVPWDTVKQIMAAIRAQAAG